MSIVSSQNCTGRSFTTASVAVLCDTSETLTAYLSGDWEYVEGSGSVTTGPPGWNDPTLVQNAVYDLKTAPPGSGSCNITPIVRFRAVEDEVKIPRSGSTLTINFTEADGPLVDSVYYHSIFILAQQAQTTATDITVIVEVDGSPLDTRIVTVPAAVVAEGTFRQGKAVMVRVLVPAGDLFPSTAEILVIPGDYVADAIVYPMVGEA